MADPSVHLSDQQTTKALLKGGGWAREELNLEHHADSPLPQLLGIPALSGHGSNLS